MEEPREPPHPPPTSPTVVPTKQVQAREILWRFCGITCRRLSIHLSPFCGRVCFAPAVGAAISCSRFTGPSRKPQIWRQLRKEKIPVPLEASVAEPEELSAVPGEWGVWIRGRRGEAKYPTS